MEISNRGESDWPHVGGGLFCSFHQEPAIRVEQPDDGIVICQLAPTLLRLETCATFPGHDLPSPRAHSLKPTPFS